MTREEEIKAAIVVTPDAIDYINPDMNQAAEDLGNALFLFVDYAESLDPKLGRLEAMRLATVFLRSLPRTYHQNPHLANELKEVAARLRSDRK